jgi:Protein of unknown function (DUF4232)
LGRGRLSYIFDALALFRQLTPIVLLVALPWTIAPDAAADSASPQCRSLSVTLLPGGAGLGHSLTVVAIRNVSMATCRLRGYAHLALYNAQGKLMPSRTQRGSAYSFTNTPSRTIQLPPGARASFYLEITSVDGSRPCPTAARLLVQAPGARPISVPFRAWISPCPNGQAPLFISTIHAGTPNVLGTR